MHSRIAFLVKDTCNTAYVGNSMGFGKEPCDLSHNHTSLLCCNEFSEVIIDTLRNSPVFLAGCWLLGGCFDSSRPAGGRTTQLH